MKRVKVMRPGGAFPDIAIQMVSKKGLRGRQTDRCVLKNKADSQNWPKLGREGEGCGGIRYKWGRNSSNGVDYTRQSSMVLLLSQELFYKY